MQRRDFLTTCFSALAATVAGQAWSAPSTDQRLLVVFLRGGYDALNVVIPTSTDFYYQSRPHIAIARPNAADPSSALALDANWSLHPALKDSIFLLWQKKQIAFIPFAGTDDMTRSHFETQDTIELGQPVAGNGGRFAGEQVALSQDTLNQGRDLPVLTDYRAMISSIAQRLYGLRHDQMAKIFPSGPAPLTSLSLL